jgi:DNA-binding XRE family transcriptional regulator
MKTLIGERIKAFRGYRPLRDLSASLGVSAQYLSQIENGKREPSRKLLQKMAAEFGSSVAYLLGETEVNTPPGGLLPASPSMAATSGNASPAIGRIEESGGSVSITVTERAAGKEGEAGNAGNAGKNIVFEREDGAAKIRIILPPTPASYEFLQKQVK